MSILKRQRRASESEDEDQLEKRQKIAATPLATAINVELSKAVTFKRSRSQSIEPLERNVRARLTVDLSSSNPESTKFLMGAIATELENINRMFSPDVSNGRFGASQSPSSSPSSPSSTVSSPDYYDRLVAHGYELMDRARQDPAFAKYL